MSRKLSATAVFNFFVGHKRMMDATPDHWKESIQHAFVMFKEAGVETVLIPDELRTAPTIRFNGELWQP